MPRFKLVVEYDGTRFHGWQHQQDGTSVQEAVERAITAFSGETRRIVAAGRTDTGVHATHQVIHVDLERDWPLRTIADAMNAHLKGGGVAILDARRVADTFDARISAVKRHYLYRIVNRRAFAVLEAGRVWQVKWPIDAARMQAGADRLIGKHDFTTFRASECQAKSPLRTLERLDIERDGDEIRIRASARSFLHSQVRSLVGSLILVATGKWTPDDIEAALKACDRSRCGPLAPPDGLYLVGVDYDGADQPV
ncbi:MAG: tRNA pseudouridine(38-40) synthase TruA [Pseudomonadota bacterium]|jgi:tRNA pseudouridine38-40 synthase